MEKTRLKELFDSSIRVKLQKALGISNVMAVPKLSKIVINIGVKDANADNKALAAAQEVLEAISGQKAVRTRARKSIAGFKLREGQAIGCKVTLRRHNMYSFLDKLINISLPRVRDFQGVPTKLDGRGNYNLGIKEWTIFPEIQRDISDRVSGLNITIETTAKTDVLGYELLKEFGMPFCK